MALRTLTLAALLPALAAAVPCVQFDFSYGLYAFGGEQDVALGAASTWACESSSGPAEEPLADRSSSATDPTKN